MEDKNLAALTLYLQALAVPSRPNAAQPDVLTGKALFTQLGCQQCHRPTLSTGPHSLAALGGQTIFPYTDLLLHDMGIALADNRPEYEANGQEWRTPPLWGLSMLKTVSRHTYLLHDGRARNIEEAILWHGGEAESAQKRFVGLTKAERDKVIRFVESL